jgi:bacterioferritin-associated ferredoxin
MYVCICQAITEAEIASAIDDGAHTVEQLRDRLSAATCCGACADVVADCIDRFAAAPPSAAVTAAAPIAS